MKKYILLLFIPFFTGNLISQEREIKKLWRYSIDNRSKIDTSLIELKELNDIVKEVEETNKQILRDILLLTEKDEIRKNQLDTSLSMYGNSTSGIGTKIDTLSIVIGVVGLILTLLGVFLGFYITNKEKSIKKLLKESNENLISQKESQDIIEQKINESKKETEKLKEEVSNNLTELYNRLKDEELKDIIENINESPDQIRNHVSRLITLNVPEDHFLLFKDILFTWESSPEDYGNISYLLVFMINKFPEKMAANQRVSPLITEHWERMGRGVNFDKLEEFLDTYINAFFNNKYQNIDQEIGVILGNLSTWYSFRYIASKTLFEKYPDKDQRFKILELMVNHDLSELLMQYKQHMLNVYSNTDNSESQNGLLDQVRRS